MKYETLQKLDEIGALDNSKNVDEGPWVNAPFKLVSELIEENSKSKPRALTYAFGATIIATLAFYLKWEVNETAVWIAMLGAGVPFGGLVVATVRTWPKRHR